MPLKLQRYVIGIVTHDGAVFSGTFDTCRGHAKLYPGAWFRWRWCREYGLRETDHDTVDDPELRERIRTHLRKRYGLDIE